jgi:hypothetical protein
VDVARARALARELYASDADANAGHVNLERVETKLAERLKAEGAETDLLADYARRVIRGIDHEYTSRRQGTLFCLEAFDSEEMVVLGDNERVRTRDIVRTEVYLRLRLIQESLANHMRRTAQEQTDWAELLRFMPDPTTTGLEAYRAWDESQGGEDENEAAG